MSCYLICLVTLLDKIPALWITQLREIFREVPLNGCREDKKDIKEEKKEGAEGVSTYVIRYLIRKMIYDATCLSERLLGGQEIICDMFHQDFVRKYKRRVFRMGSWEFGLPDFLQTLTVIFNYWL